MSFIRELKRRNVFRVAIAYIVAAWVIIEVSSVILDIYDAPDSVAQIIVALLALGLPFVIFFAWAFEITPDGVKRDEDVAEDSTIGSRPGNRLTLMTVGLAVVALAFFMAGRFLPGSTGDAELAGEDKTVWAAKQLLEVNRLRDIGATRAAFALATEIEPLLAGSVSTEDLFADISRSAEIETEPPGAVVLIQSIFDDTEEPLKIGTTPIREARFAIDDGYRVRFELHGYRSVEVLENALVGRGWYRDHLEPMRPVKLDPVDELPEDMVRIPGFTEDEVDYADYFMDRYEVTNRNFQRFVDAGGYTNLAFWVEAFVLEGKDLSPQDALNRFVDKTGRPGPSTWSGGAYPSGQGEYPVGGVSWYEAAAYARFMEKELPSWAHHRWARRYFDMSSWIVSPRSNFSGEGPRPVGTNHAMSTAGLYDLMGNVREWSRNETGNNTRGTTGSGWPDPPYLANLILPKSPWDRDPTHGLRLIRTFDAVNKLAALHEPIEPLVKRNYYEEEPVSDAEFEIYRRLYEYDASPLNAEIVEFRAFDSWRRERVEFDLPSGERGGAFLYIPNNAAPPYQTVVHWPGDQSMVFKSVDEAYLPAFDFIVRSGRVVAQPMLTGTYDRDDENFSLTDHDVIWGDDDIAGKRYRDFQIKWVQELSRTIDYLETRSDIRIAPLAYYGFSWGGSSGSTVLAIEDRLRFAVLNVGGLDDTWGYQPEADGINFVTRVKVPVLMINGEFDTIYPYETSQKPMFDLLGTPAEHKKIHVTPAAHVVPRDELIRETLDWFDKYFEALEN